MDVTGKRVLANRERVVDLLRAMLSVRVPKTSGRDKTLSEVHSTVCELVRKLSPSPFYISTEFSSKEKHVAAALLCKSRVLGCFCVNIDSPDLVEPTEIDVWLCS